METSINIRSPGICRTSVDRAVDTKPVRPPTAIVGGIRPN
jgi:hypothetical protein